jgi:hypothetical protein
MTAWRKREDKPAKWRERLAEGRALGKIVLTVRNAITLS